MQERAAVVSSIAEWVSSIPIGPRSFALMVTTPGYGGIVVLVPVGRVQKTASGGLVGPERQR